MAKSRKRRDSGLDPDFKMVSKVEDPDNPGHFLLLDELPAEHPARLGVQQNFARAFAEHTLVPFLQRFKLRAAWLKHFNGEEFERFTKVLFRHSLLPTAETGREVTDLVELMMKREVAKQAAAPKPRSRRS